MITGPTGFGPEYDRSGRGPAAIVNDRPVLSSERAPHFNKSQLSVSNKDLVVSPRLVLYSKIGKPTDRRS
jgi:hypothetical protein